MARPWHAFASKSPYAGWKSRIAGTPLARSWHAAGSLVARDRMARSIGRLDEVTRLILDELAEAGIPARSCAPVRKLDAEAFKRTTRWPRRTGQEARDAGMLCWGVAAHAGVLDEAAAALRT
ncbi:MAG: hypothetical protein LCH53_14280 [Bacteroidetes bacterium]|nr:hypothetical protein [Bacteroidota bacterium]